jgi:choline dehydrogenase
MAYHRGTKQTYDKWADQVGDKSYTLENWQPFFEKSIKFSAPDTTKRGANATAAYDVSTLSGGEPGPLSVGFSNYAQAPSTWFEKGFSEIGISPIDGFTSGKLLGSSWVLGTINGTTQTRDSSETAFLQPELGRNYNLVVYVSTLGKRIIFDSSKTAKGVAVSTNGLEYVLSANKEVIVSSGAFQSPQLLMVSGVGPASTLAKYKIPLVANRPGVGQNLWVSSVPTTLP